MRGRGLIEKRGPRRYRKEMPAARKGVRVGDIFLATFEAKMGGKAGRHGGC